MNKEGASQICPACKSDMPVDSKFCFQCGINITIKTEFTEDFEEQKREIKVDLDLLEQYKTITEQLLELSNLEGDIVSQEEHYQEIFNHYQMVKERVFELRKKLSNEKDDVKELEKFSITKLVAKVKGEYNTKLSKEKAEYEEAITQLEVAEKEYQKINQQLSLAREQSKTIKSYRKKKRALEIEQKKILDLVSQTIQHKEEDALQEELEAMNMEITPIGQKYNNLKDARDSAKSAIRSYRQAKKLLQKAKGLSNWDTFGGGGIIVDSMKHSRINDGRSFAAVGNRLLDRAQQSFKKAGGTSSYAGAKVDGGNKAVDMFLDGLIVDLYARKKISYSLDSVSYALSRASSLLAEIKVKLKPTKKEYDRLYQQIKTKETELKEFRKSLLAEFIKNQGKKNVA